MSIFGRSHGSRRPQSRIFRDGSNGKSSRNNFTGDSSSLDLSLAITRASAAIAARAVGTTPRGQTVILGSVEQDFPAVAAAVISTTVRTFLVFPADLKGNLAMGLGTVDLARNRIALAIRSAAWRSAAVLRSVQQYLMVVPLGIFQEYGEWLRLWIHTVSQYPLTFVSPPQSGHFFLAFPNASGQT